jgi:hypothetical protein
MSCTTCVQFEDDHDGQHAAVACVSSDEQDWSELRPLRGHGKPDDLCARETDLTHTGQGRSSCSKTKDQKELRGKKSRRQRKRKHTPGPSSRRNSQEEDPEEETASGEDQVAGRDWALHNTPTSESGGKAHGEWECCTRPRRGTMEVLPGLLQQLVDENISEIDGPTWDQGYYAEARVDNELLTHIEQLQLWCSLRQTGLPEDHIEADLMDLSVRVLRMLRKCLFEEEVELHQQSAERISALSGQIPQLAMLAIFGLRLQKLVAVVGGQTEWAAQLVNPFSFNGLTGNTMALSNNRMYEAEVLHGRWGLLGWLGM